ncbi:MAG: hypothetical protein ACSNEK_07735 [Parachlamydiaceae bacterium]
MSASLQSNTSQLRNTSGTDKRNTDNADSQPQAAQKNGRNWKKITKIVAFSTALAAITAVGLISTAMLVLGVVAMFFPGIGTAAGAGLSVLGGAISGAAAVSLGFVAANATGFVVGASVGLGVTGFASAVLVVVTRLCFRNKESQNSNLAGTSSTPSENKESHHERSTHSVLVADGDDLQGSEIPLQGSEATPKEGKAA